jgi:type VI secretion system protein ImpC
MAKFPNATVSLDVDAGAEPLPAKPDSDTPFRILVLGDFSGRGNRGEPAAARLRPYLIDRDNFDQVIARIRPELELGEHGRGIVLQFRELEDFHPDRIYGRAACFGKLRETHRKLGDPDTFAEAAATVKSWSSVPAPAATPPDPAPRQPASAASRPDMAALSGGSLLDNILEATEAAPARPVRQPDELRAFIDRVVAPHVAPRQDAQLPDLVAQVDAAAARLMRGILHHRDFQALEAAWRALFFLARELETGPQLKLYVLDVSKADLAGALGELHRILVDEAVATPGAEPWSLVAGNFTFAQTASDVHLLGELGRIMRAAGAPFLAEADLSEADSADTALRWNALRHSPGASWIGLALPRFLLRLPYGEKTETVESFTFEEMPGAPVHQKYLWGNPAFACTYLLGQAFPSYGWDLRPGAHQEIRGLPLHVYDEDGEQQLKPCAEMLMTEGDAEWILERGFMPLVSIKNQDVVRLLRFQSIAEPLARLSGPWS